MSHNPWIEPELPGGKHVREIVHLALSDWVNNQKFPYVMRGAKGELELSKQDMLYVQQGLRSVLVENEDKLTEFLKGKLDA